LRTLPEKEGLGSILGAEAWEEYRQFPRDLERLLPAAAAARFPTAAAATAGPTVRSTATLCRSATSAATTA